MVFDDLADLLQPPLGFLSAIGRPGHDIHDDRLGQGIWSQRQAGPAAILGAVGLDRLDAVEERVVGTMRALDVRRLRVAVQLRDEALGLLAG